MCLDTAHQEVRGAAAAGSEQRWLQRPVGREVVEGGGAVRAACKGAQLPASAESPSTHCELDDAKFDAGVTDDLVEFHEEVERRIFSLRGGEARNEPLDARLRDPAVKFMWSLCQEAVRLLPPAGFQAATLFDIACLRHPGGILPRHVPLVCTVIVKLLKKADSSTTFVPNASLVAHAQRMVEYLRSLGYSIPDATEDELRTLEAELLVTFRWSVEHFTIESWLSIFVSRFNIITGGIHAAKLNQVWEQSMLCARALVLKRPASPETPPLALARGLLGVSFVCVGLLPMEAAEASAIMDSLQTAVMASPERMQAAYAVAAAALQQAGGEVQATLAAQRAQQGLATAAAAQGGA